MNKIYNANKIYLISIAQTTKVEEPGWRTDGATHYRVSKKQYFAKLVASKTKSLKKINTYKIISKDMIIEDDHSSTKEGDYFVVEATPLKMIVEENFAFVKKDVLIKTEKWLNEQNEKEEEKTHQ